MNNCVLCGKEVQKGGYSTRIGGVLLRPLCVDCDQLCSQDPKRVIEEHHDVFEKMLVERRDAISAGSETTVVPQGTQRSQRERKMLTRYRDAYLRANAIVSIGDATKVIGIVLAVAICLVTLLLVAQIRGDSGFGLLFVGIVVAAISGLVCYTLGVLIAAIGQMLLAQLDGAVNSSPFLTDELKAEVLTV